MRTAETLEAIRKILSIAPSSGEAIRDIYDLLKKHNPKISVAYLCTKAGIPSKGSLADAMSGRRLLKFEYAKGLAKAFALPRYEAKVFVGLLALDHTKDMNEKAKLEADLESWRKVLSAERRKVEDASLTSPRWLAKLFTSLSLLEKPIHLHEISKLLRNHTETEIRTGLATLEGMNLIKRNGDHIELLHSQIIFQPTEVSHFQIEFLKDSLREALEQAGHWYKQSGSSFYESSLLTVNREAFRKRLPEIKDFFEKIQSDMETEKDADELICLNVQIYPLNKVTGD